MADLTPVDTLRAAAKLLRGEPAPEPHPKRLPPAMPDAYAEPLADWLDLTADEYDREPCDDPTGVCNRCEWDPSAIPAFDLARLILGRPQ